MPGNESEALVGGGWAKVVDLHVAGHGEGVEGAVELGHGFVEEGGDDASVDVARSTFVELGEEDVCGDGVRAGEWVGRVGEVEVEALRVCGAAAEAVVGLLVDGGVLHGRVR